jgi:hypothetical protein
MIFSQQPQLYLQLFANKVVFVYDYNCRHGWCFGEGDALFQWQLLPEQSYDS